VRAVASLILPICLSIPRSGSERHQLDDAGAWAIHPDDTLHIAVADGATESIYSGLWARTLTDAAIRQYPWDGTAIRWAWLAEASRRFSCLLPDLSDAPWYIHNKLLDGSFATLSASRLDLSSATLEAVAVGDSCIAIISDTAAGVQIFPARYANPASFRGGPALVPSNPRFAERLDLVAEMDSFQLPAGGVQVLLLTDALAHWFVTELSAGQGRWRTLLSIPEDGVFRDFALAERHAGRLRDDDTLLIRFSAVVKYR
jgi:hypothetical protein